MPEVTPITLIPIYRHNNLSFYQEIGSGTTPSGRPFEICLLLPSGNIRVRLGGHSLDLTAQQIAEALMPQLERIADGELEALTFTTPLYLDEEPSP